MLTFPIIIKLVFISFFLSQNYYLAILIEKLTKLPIQLTQWISVWIALLCVHHVDTLYKNLYNKLSTSK